MPPEPSAEPSEPFTALYYPGPGFVQGAELEEQPEFRTQVVWWRQQAAAGRLQLVGVVTRESNDPAICPGVAIVWNAADQEAATQLAEAAPLVQSGVFRVSLVPGAPKP